MIEALRAEKTVRNAGELDAGTIYAELVITEDMKDTRGSVAVVEQGRNDSGEQEIVFAMNMGPTFPLSGRVETILGGVGRGSGQTRPIIAFRAPITPTGAAAPRPEYSPQRERGGSARPRRPGTKSAGGSSR